MRIKLLLVLHGDFAHDAHVALDDLAVRQFVLGQDSHRREDLVTDVALLVAGSHVGFHVLLQL